MSRPVCDQLVPIRRRQRWSFALRIAAWGLIASSLVAIGMELARTAGLAVSATAVWGVLAAGPVLAGLFGLVARQSLQSAAVAVDSHYRLKDRVLTALSFVRKSVPSGYAELQIADALQHLTQVEPRQVVPVRIPRSGPYAVGALLVAVLLNVWPVGSPEISAGLSEPLPIILAQADQISEDLKDLAEIASKEKNAELEKLGNEQLELRRSDANCGGLWCGRRQGGRLAKL